MGERLALVRRTPEAVLDWHPRLGAGRQGLAAAYPRAAAFERHTDGTVHAAAPGRSWWRRLPGRDRPPGPFGLLWSNMGLHFEPDPPATFSGWHAALADGGFLMFSTLGPGSLEALAAAHRRAGFGPAFAPFVDMHDLGDMLVRAGFADPVMDQETLTLSWPDARAMLAELRTLGGNADVGRHAGLRTPRWRERLLRGLDELRPGPAERPRLVFEVVYGHAFKVARRVSASTSQVPLQTLRDELRSRRERPPPGSSDAE
jgi:malonyl-CoA O-methyltransferase